MRETELDIQLPYWMIVFTSDPQGYHTGRQFSKTTLYQSNNPAHIREIIAEGVVEAGESNRAYLFKVIAMSQSFKAWENMERCDQ